MLHERLCMCVLVSAVMCLGACERHSYSVKVAADPGDPSKLMRTLELSSKQSRTSDVVRAEVERLTALYGTQPTEKAPEPRKANTFFEMTSSRTLTFKGSFDSPPHDISTGGGIFACYTSDLGTVRLYAEQFRGNYQLADRLERQRRACVLLGECLAVLVEQEMGTLPRSKEFATFARTKFVKDLHDLALAARFEAFADDHARQKSADPGVEDPDRSLVLIVRLSLFLVERGYLNEQDAGRFVMNVLSSRDEGEFLNRPQVSHILRALVLRTAGDGATELADRLVDVAVPQEKEEQDALNATIDRVAAAPSVQALLDQKIPLSGDGEDQPRSLDQLRFGLAPLFDLGPGIFDFDKFSMEVSFPGELLNANARPTQQPGGTTAVSWQTQTLVEPAEGIALPKTAVAMFAAPAAEFQTKHLGGVKLKGKSLLNYCIAYAQLDQGERERWDREVSPIVFAHAAGAPATKDRETPELSPNLRALNMVLVTGIAESDSPR